jgi:hypothetical protein
MHGCLQDEWNSALELEKQSWTERIERSLQCVTQDIEGSQNADDPHSAEGWVLIERALRHGAQALHSMSRSV